MLKTVDAVHIRTDLRPGDLGYVMHRHGILYGAEYGYSISFESYVAAGLYEFYSNYDPGKDRVWICEHDDLMVGFLLLMHRPGNSAQLRFFFLEPAYRGMGLGKKLLSHYMGWLEDRAYRSSYLWTTHEQTEAIALYKKFGFQLTDEKHSTTFGKPLTEQRYEIILV